MGNYVIETLQDDGSWDNTGEGPFDTRDEACRFAEAEVGARYRIVEVPTPTHTPGPWRVEFRLNRLMVRAGEADVVAVAMPDEQDSKANARLIAAAPDLLAALEMFVDQYQGSGQDERELRPEMIAARAAIAKAKGDQPSA